MKSAGYFVTYKMAALKRIFIFLLFWLINFSNTDKAQRDLQAKFKK